MAIGWVHPEEWCGVVWVKLEDAFHSGFSAAFVKLRKSTISKKDGGAQNGKIFVRVHIF